MNFASTEHLAGPNIAAGTTATMPQDGSRALVTKALSITSGGKLDLTDNALIVGYTGGSPISTIQSLLGSGYAGGPWNGNGIMSSTAAATPNRGLGFAEATDLFTSFPATFAAPGIDDSAVLVRYTVSSDANLDRVVDVRDLYMMAINWLESGRRWSQGDFTFDQFVGATDLGKMAINWQQTSPQPAPPMPAVPTAARRPATRTPVRTIDLVNV